MKKTILILFFLVSRIVFACDCPPLNPVSVKETEKYDAVFYGAVDSVGECVDGFANVYFTIKEVYKGVLEAHAAVRFDCATSCSMSFDKKEEWLIYAVYKKFDVLAVNFCWHSRKFIEDESKDYFFTISQKTFEQEKKYLQQELGILPIVKRNHLNEQQKELKHQNQLPSLTTMLVLLLVSTAAMFLIYFITKKYFKK
jgi:hypothetical protein